MFKAIRKFLNNLKKKPEISSDKKKDISLQKNSNYMGYKFKQLFKENMEPDWDFIMRIREFKALADTKQSSVWHQEGDALTHTRMVTENMYKWLISYDVEKDDPYFLMMMSAALCHDLGKAVATSWNEEKNDWECKRHGFHSARIIRTLFFTEEFSIRERVCYMARYHMTLHHIFDKPERTSKALMRMSMGLVKVCDMNILQWCDSLGSKNEETPEYIEEKTKKIEDAARELGCYDMPYSSFRNKWHMLEFFRQKDEWSPTEIDVPEESDNTRLRIYMMVGVPGSGKDYFIENYDFGEPVVNLSRDIIRTEIGLTGEKPQGNKEQEKEVTRIFDERMEQFCKEGRSFVINNTNVRKQYRDGYLDKCLKYFPEIIYVYCEAPSLNVNKERRQGMMPVKVIDRMWNDMEFPEPVEYSKMIVRKQYE